MWLLYMCNRPFNYSVIQQMNEFGEETPHPQIHNQTHHLPPSFSVFQPSRDQGSVVSSGASWPAIHPVKGGSWSGCWDATEEQQQQCWRWDNAHPGSATAPLQAPHGISVGRVHQDLGYGPKFQEPQSSEQHGANVSSGGGTRSGPGVCNAAGE